MRQETQPVGEQGEFGDGQRPPETDLNIGEMAVGVAVEHHAENQRAMLSRRRVLKWGGGLVLALSSAGTVARIAGHIWHEEAAPTLTVLSLKHDFDDMMAALPTDEQLLAQVPYLVDGRGQRITSVNLDAFQAIRGTSGPVDSTEGIVGTSNNLGRGTMSDSGGPFNQPHSVGEVAEQSLDSAARSTLGLGAIRIGTFAIPGAYSGYAYPGESRQYGILAQLSDPRLHKFLIDADPDELVWLRYEGGFDDYRLMAVNTAQLAGNLSGIIAAVQSKRLVTPEEAQRATDQFHAMKQQMQTIATNYGLHLETAAEIIAGINHERIARGHSNLVWKMVTPWSLEHQNRLAFSALSGDNNDPALGKYLKPDLTDSQFLNRWYLDVGAIPGGHDIAHWAWVLMLQAQNTAMQRIMARYPELLIIPEDLYGVNDQDNFYLAQLPDGTLDPDGDGHPGMVNNRIAGIQQLAVVHLGQWERNVYGKGQQQASAYAHFPGSVAA